MAIATPPRRLAWQLATVVAMRDETPRARTLTLEVPGWPGHLPGQHLDVRLTASDGYRAERSYSLASPPEEPHLAITVERLADGEVSPYLAGELRPGDRLELRGPIGGHFTWTAAAGGPLLLVAGGSGIVPLMAMLRHRAAAGSAVPTRLLYSARAYDDILYRDELAALAADDAALRVVQTLTRVRPPGWTGHHGRIDVTLLAEVAWPPDARPHTFVCGPTPLVEHVATALVGLGHDPARIKTERFGPTGG